MKANFVVCTQKGLSGCTVFAFTSQSFFYNVHTEPTLSNTFVQVVGAAVDTIEYFMVSHLPTLYSIFWVKYL